MRFPPALRAIPIAPQFHPLKINPSACDWASIPRPRPDPEKRIFKKSVFAKRNKMGV
jgi:hypothetical protein